MHVRHAIHSALLVLLATPAMAQQPDDPSKGRIIGRILDAESSEPIADVVVSVPERGIPPVLTDRNGCFAVGDLERGIYPLELQHVAYGTHEQLVNVPPGRTVEIEIRLAARAIELDPIAVAVTIRSPYLEDRGYYRRERMGFGTFFTEEDIAKWGLRNTLHLVPRGRVESIGASAFRYTLIFQRGFRTCVPPVWIDGLLIRLRGSAISDMIDENNIGALEAYAPGQTPGEFIGSGIYDCGAIVIWSRHRIDR